jgi:hypothetical protein
LVATILFCPVAYCNVSVKDAYMELEIGVEPTT